MDDISQSKRIRQNFKLAISLLFYYYLLLFTRDKSLCRARKSIGHRNGGLEVGRTGGLFKLRSGRRVRASFTKIG